MHEGAKHLCGWHKSYALVCADHAGPGRADGLLLHVAPALLMQGACNSFSHMHMHSALASLLRRWRITPRFELEILEHSCNPC